MMPYRIPYGRQNIDQSDIDAVIEVLNSPWLTQGPTIERFEKALAEHCQAEYAVAVCNATAALHIACRVAGLGPGDYLWTSPNTFVASANCGRYCGADVDFVDIDPHTLNLDARLLAEKLEIAEAAGKLPKVVVAVAFAGQSCDMRAISQLSERYGFTLIEDASHAVGASYLGRPVGCGQYAAMTIFSFHPVKIITSAEGGMVLTNRPEFADRLRRLRSHGITGDPAQMSVPDTGLWYYQQLELGFNYRMTDLHAALGLSQMARLDAFVARRRQLAARYETLLAGIAVTLPAVQSGAESAWHLYVVRLQLEQIKLSQTQVFEALRAAGLGVNLHYIPVHLQPYYREQGFKDGDFPEAERYFSEAISLPLYPDLTDEEQDEVVGHLRRILG
ncbi:MULTISPECIES: UDP-4-amino-4,6-dideoxy-N-acetyl-beta-L-altrosamine transaminase [Pseudomonas]|jgi:UDP-4-amino-4,6-dideoxy-N-acetyl-beta-L-altrosamine transaminase|uniref:Flagellin modification protein FlmB n=2 Tax=Pseudomonas fluorescens group TaxID=136843 RepID=A0A024EIP6_9PSED|nr:MULTISPECIES: UDP-4-amino-4,6-dideoxy-N-acetyl-beta-L-altrosamine transaminase [Pseudomonas]AHZ72213.1 flagellin modification protein FlmB [Pseudomonas mandelii JR-1]MBA4361373.1 UDP-4-amino-4,6-dideoxy-N-acetyl-beta-L-altrosamine transaminase [Pseudomonas sp.]MDI1331954.1 UDP-4-amino-4,6-dideoxy-N-acetyl-beta-L-altrosamine transaminase [Pseudomonas sp.]MDO8710503.1 UDP-4-amino-4,6-dideoxy-N-acetyl-beta-L-altrosamine transaminase [Pseudomonas sp.]MDO9331970.1 UDP-4-amino-4,6-dideoxy-N-acety